MLEFIILVVSLLINILLGLFVFYKNRHSRTNQMFFFLTIAIALWSAANFVSVHPLVFSQLVWIRLVIFFASILNLAVYLTFDAFPKVRFTSKKRFRIFAVVYTAIVMILALTPAIFPHLDIKNGRPEAIPGPAIVLFLGQTVVLLLGAILKLIQKFRKSRGVERNQYRFITFGIISTFTLIFLTNFILPAFFKNSTFVPFGATYTLIFSISFTYAIVRHRLFDIRAAVARSVAFVLLITTLAGVYGVVAFQVINVVLKGSSATVRQLADVLLAVVLAFTFGPLRRFFERMTDKVFYRDRYDPQELANKIGRILASEIDLERLCHKVINELTGSMRLSFADIVVFGEKEVHFQTRVFSPEHHNILIADLKKLGRLAVVRDELTTGERKEVMDKYGISASLALRTSEEFIGYLMLGEKKSGDIYNDQDIQILKIIANELSVAIQNAKAFTEIQLFNETLQEKVQRATKNLRHANDQLKELDQAKDEFISMASHQLRTPLTTVKGYASMLSEGDFGKLSKEQEEPVKEALDGASRMARLIDDLLNVSRMEAGKFFIDAQPTDVIKMTQQEVDQLQSLATSKKVELKYDPPKSPIKPVTLDENKTRQVIMNLVDNAIHYSQPPAGGGHVHVKLAVEGDNLVFTVQDDGIGVSKEFQPKLFQKMNRSEAAKKVRPDGTGLGLYLVKRVVEDQGGQIIFQSEEHKGSTFGFRVPLSGVPKELLGKAKEIAKTAHLSA